MHHLEHHLAISGEKQPWKGTGSAPRRILNSGLWPLADPTAAIGKVNALPAPSLLKIRLADNSGAHLTIVRPDLVSATGELSDSELEQVPGGGPGGTNRCAASCVVSSIG